MRAGRFAGCLAGRGIDVSRAGIGAAAGIGRRVCAAATAAAIAAAVGAGAVGFGVDGAPGDAPGARLRAGAPPR